MIVHSSDKLIGIIMDVIEISQIQTSQVEVKFSEIKVESLINKVVNPFYDKAENMKTQLLLHKNNIDGNTIIISDDWKIERIIFHLLDNAVKFTHQGSIEIHFDLNNENLKVIVSDTGIGVEPEQQEYIFEPFRQVENETHRNYGGLGLGLTLVREYVNLLQGQLSFKSEFGKGTTVTIEIPTKEYSNINHLENKIDVILKQTASDRNTVLIVEDDLNSFLFLKEAFENEDLIVLHACNGQIAVEMCNSNKEIALVLMDFKMPVMDGETAAKEIKLIRPDLPIVAQTAYVNEINLPTKSEYFDDYLSKPVMLDVLKKKISTYLR